MIFEEFLAKLRAERDVADDTSIRRVYEHLVATGVDIRAMIEGRGAVPCDAWEELELAAENTDPGHLLRVNQELRRLQRARVTPYIGPLRGLLGRDAAGRELHELLHAAAEMLTHNGPLSDCLRQKAYQLGELAAALDVVEKGATHV